MFFFGIAIHFLGGFVFYSHFFLSVFNGFRYLLENNSLFLLVI